MSTLKLVHETREYLFHEVVDRCICLSHIEQSQRREMFSSLYWPVYSYILEQRESTVATAGAGERKPFLIGISAPQGCGKTTLTTVLEEMFAFTGLPAASMSLDDFYLIGEEQDRLAANYSSNTLLRYRGNGTLLITVLLTTMHCLSSLYVAGTHDLPLLWSTMQSLRHSESEREDGSVISIPRYDKSLRQGRGDRSDNSLWPKMKGPLQIVLFEGWMLGFKSVDECRRHELEMIHNGLPTVNEFLRDYAGLHFLFDAWVVLKVESPIVVYDWRLEAERNMRKAGKPSLSDEQVQDFIDRFMPAYQAYLPALYASGPERRENTTALIVSRYYAMSCSTLTLSLWCEQVAMDRNRRATSFEEVPPVLTSRLASI